MVESFTHFWDGPFSQWHPCTFKIDMVRYNCAEQFMMAEKARLFGDEGVRAQILATGSPRAHKALGRQVAGFDQATWEAERVEIVVRGNLAKFSQNPEMCAALLATGDKTMVEASPYDRIWGVGLRADDSRVHDPERWRGANLLGEALMKVRAQLRAERAAS